MYFTIINYNNFKLYFKKDQIKSALYFTIPIIILIHILIKCSIIPKED